MTKQSIRDEFIIRYKIEVQKRGISEIKFNPEVLSLWIETAEQYLQRQLKILQSSQDITIVSGTSTYDLSSNFGNVREVRISSNGQNYSLEQKDIDYVNALTTSTGSANVYAIYFTGTTGKIKINPIPTSGTMTVHYYPDIASHTSGDVLSEDFSFQDKYKVAAILHMLTNVFDDYWVKLDAEMTELQRVRSNSFDSGLDYSFAEVSL